ncbi:MAG: hypothetical protein HYU58_00180 [Proteobacteria bacterium]|nr:hypothetical protein [Pseudomonadota bacterium]
MPTRRGRPRKSEAANDNTPDRGTAELQMKRAMLAQGKPSGAATHPLDLLLAHGLIDPAESSAGWHYAALYRRVIGRTEMSYGRLYAGLAGESGGRPTDIPVDPAVNEAELAAAQALFRAAQAALRKEGAVFPMGRASASTVPTMPTVYAVSISTAWCSTNMRR